MKFELVATEFFIEQIRDLDRKSKDPIKEKISLNIRCKEMRLIYAVLSNVLNIMWISP